MTTATHMAHETDEAVVHADGWFIIRNTEDPAQWLASDAPVDIRR